MEYLNINVSVLDGPEVVGSDPVDRATWLFLLRYCVGQENGGEIKGASSWGDRKWQQLACVTLREVKRTSLLWSWVGADLVVFAYPKKQEREVVAKRVAGHATALKRWGKRVAELPAELFADSDSATCGSGSVNERERETPAEEKLGPWIRTGSSDPERSQANRQELRQLVEVHGLKSVQAKAEQLAHAAGVKVWPSDLSAAFLASNTTAWKAPKLNFTPKYA